jgi:hypothetical protein
MGSYIAKTVILFAMFDYTQFLHCQGIEKMSAIKEILKDTMADAKSKSHGDDSYKVFKRVESRFSRMNRSRLAAKLEEYREGGFQLTAAELFRESHSSEKLGKFLRVTGFSRPGPRWEAHHIVSATHREAVPVRLLISEDDFSIRIDDPDNGTWMPKTKADARPTIYPDAIGHNRIHRQRYYRWLEHSIGALMDDAQVRAFLNTVRSQLLHGNIKDEIKLQQEIDEAEYNDWLKKST